MIGKLTGRFGGIGSDGTAILEVRGVGYAVHAPAAALEALRKAKGDATLLIHTVVREDAIALYGFMSQEELSFFRQLTQVSGIGPKSALAILNVTDVKTLKRSIAAGEAAALTKVFGIGRKSAERIVVELRDKLGKEVADMGHAVGDVEVLEALMALGYSAAESRKALSMAGAAGGETPERIAAALKHLSRHSS